MLLYYFKLKNTGIQYYCILFLLTHLLEQQTQEHYINNFVLRMLIQK